MTGVLSTLVASAMMSAISAYVPPSAPMSVQARPVIAVGMLQPSPRSARVGPLPPPHTPVEIQRHVLAGQRLRADPSLYMGQAHVESRHDCDAVSPAGAVGCAQFLRATWEKDVRPRLGPECADAPRTHPECSFRGQVAYMDMVSNWLPIDADHDTAMAAYNAGAGSVGKEQKACAMRPGCDPSRWESVQEICLRRASACAETRDYVPQIRKAARQFKVGYSQERGVEAALSFSF